MNIFEKLSAITNELRTVAKNLEIKITENNKYKAVSETDVLKAVKPLEEKYKVYSYPYSRDIVESKEIEQKKTNYTTIQQFMRIKTVYRFVNMEDPTQFVDITTYGDGIDSGDKAPGKAMTYADKYALLKAYKINTGEDPDAEASPEVVKNKPSYDAEIIKLEKQCCELGLDLGSEQFVSYVEKQVGKVDKKTMTNDEKKKYLGILSVWYEKQKK